MSGMKDVAIVATAILLAAPAFAEADTAENAGEADVIAAAAPKGAVARAQVTTAVVQREPQDAIDRISGEVDELTYFSELVDLTGYTVSHIWEYQGMEMARVSFQVGGDRWRVHSTKRLDPSWRGAWRVVVVDQDGHELRSDHFYYAAEKAAASAAPANEAPPAAPE